ncbi:MAG: o-succinylbenzoate synthase, partial [Calditrichales bacterium]
GIRDIAGWLDQVLPANQWYPAFRFAIESALYGLFSDTPGRDNANPERRIHVNTLIMETGPDVKSSLSKALSQGYRAVKLKVGRAPLDSEISTVRWVQEYIAGKATLRLDANRAWDMTSAVRFLSSVKVEQIEYIEEPLRDPAELTELHSRTGVALALDESLAENDPQALQLPGGTAAFILKPAVIGSLAKCEQLIKIANAQRITVVISDTFQSGVGLSFLIDLAASLGSDTPMGFDTYRQIKTDILRERLQICNGAFSLADVIRKSRQVDMARLEKI